MPNGRFCVKRGMGVIVEFNGPYHFSDKVVRLTHIRLGNVGVFARTAADQAFLMENVDPGAY